MITNFIHDFFTNIWLPIDSTPHFGLEFLAQACGSMLCTIPFALLLRPIMGKKVSAIMYIALNIAFFALQAYSFNGGIL